MESLAKAQLIVSLDCICADMHSNMNNSELQHDILLILLRPLGSVSVNVSLSVYLNIYFPAVFPSAHK